MAAGTIRKCFYFVHFLSGLLLLLLFADLGIPAGWQRFASFTASLWLPSGILVYGLYRQQLPPWAKYYFHFVFGCIMLWLAVILLCLARTIPIE